MVEIRRYTPADEPGLYDLIRSEGNEWRGYWSRWTACVQAMDRCEVFVVRKRGRPECGEYFFHKGRSRCAM